MKQLFNPDSFCPQGRSRLISVDVLRGISILFIPLIHDIDAFVNKDYVLHNLTGFAKFLAIIVAIPAVLFAHWRGFFIMISGITYSYTQFSTNNKLTKVLKDTCIRCCGSLVLLPIFYCLDVV